MMENMEYWSDGMMEYWVPDLPPLQYLHAPLLQ
jgi:hypothetical protein